MAALWAVVVAVVGVKVLLLNSYRSTDFEVHRNWLAITHSLPISKWYYENTSEWTLDYPPLFAWFEYILSQVAVLFDPKMLAVTNLNYASPQTVLFQRLTVIITDLLFVYAVKEFCVKFLASKRRSADHDNLTNDPVYIVAIILISNFGLFIVDHIHFQYNGFLFGLMLLSVLRMYEGRHLSAAFWFTVLLNFKHIYLYVAPAYFIYLLRCYVFQSSPDGRLRWRSFSILRLIGLGIIVTTVTAVSFGPFIALEQLPQVLSRLFPFKRGLCHAYWAPNFWVFYNMADKVAAVLGPKYGLMGNTSVQPALMTGGLVQEFQHTVLPTVTPLVTLIVSVVAMLPAVLLQWIRPNGPQSFVRTLVLCAFGSFMFGWHVHEKAILLVIIPLSLLVLESKKDASTFLILSTVGHYSLFPLLFTQAETSIKICALAVTSMYAFVSLSNYYRQTGSWFNLPLLGPVESLYVLGLVPLQFYSSVLHSSLGVTQGYPFLPLLLTSVYCALGVTYCWLRFYWTTLFNDKPTVKTINQQ